MRKFFTLAALLACAVPVHAGSVTVQADDTIGVSFFPDPVGAMNNPLIMSNPALAQAVALGDDLLVGSTVLVGSFLISDVQIQSNATDLSYLLSNFRQYGTDFAKVGDNYPGKAGIFDHTITASADALSLVGSQIYVFVLGSTDTTSYVNSVNTAFQIGIYYLDKAFDSDWAFKSDAGVPNSATIDLADLTVSGAGTQLVPTFAHAVVGSLGADSPNNIPGSAGKNLALAALPEPGTALLTLGGGLALSLGRRRRS